MHEKPGAPWVKLGADLFSVEGKDYLLMADYYSLYPVVKELQSMTASTVISVTKEILSVFGTPREIVSDNGPCFLSQYEEFCSKWGIKHTTTSPRHPQANGFIENRVKYVKQVIKKCLKSGEDINRALLNIRATPISNILPSPAELLFGRPISIGMPSHACQMGLDVHREELTHRTGIQKEHADIHTKDLPPLIGGQYVRVLDKTNKQWHPARVVKQHSERSYIVEKQGGNQIRRNRVQLREAPPPRTEITRGPEPSAGVSQDSPSPNVICEDSGGVNASPEPQSPIQVAQPEQERQTRSGRFIKTPERYRD